MKHKTTAEILNVFNQKWYVVCPPFGDGTWIRAGAPDASGEYVVDCKTMIDHIDGGLSDEQAVELAEYLVMLHNKNLGSDRSKDSDRLHWFLSKAIHDESGDHALLIPWPYDAVLSDVDIIRSIDDAMKK